MHILWFTWKDRTHPLAGGAEVVNEELAKRLALDGHEVVFLVGGYAGSTAEDARNGFKIIRLGNRWSVYHQARAYYKKHFKGWADLVIDEVNTVPFFCRFFVKEKNILLSYQLCREIWFYQLWFPLNLIGYLLEPIYLWLLRSSYVLTESESTKKDLQKYGFKKGKIFVFRIGLDIKPITEEELSRQDKGTAPAILFLGSVRRMKRPDHLLKAFNIIKKRITSAKLFIVGSGDSYYAKKFFKSVADSPYRSDITCFGRVEDDKKLQIMRAAKIIGVTSVKEGWGLIVTEANSQGTPAVTYDVDGLRDACKNGYTGLTTRKNTPEGLAQEIMRLLQDESLYERIRSDAWKESLGYTYDNCYKMFINQIEKIHPGL